VTVRSLGKTSQPGSSGPESREGSLTRLRVWLGRGWWVGLGVILAVAGTVVGLILSSGSSTTYSNHGDCNAQGSDNTVICSTTNAKTGR
jgi:hypothetical protein